MIKDDEIHTHEIFVWNDFILVGDSLIAYLSENFSSYDTTTHGPKRCLGKDLRIQNLVLTLKKNSHTEIRSHFKYALVGIGFDELDRVSFDKQCFDRQMKDCAKTLTTQYSTKKIILLEIPNPVDCTYDQMLCVKAMNKTIRDLNNDKNIRNKVCVFSLWRFLYHNTAVRTRYAYVTESN